MNALAVALAFVVLPPPIGPQFPVHVELVTMEHGHAACTGDGHNRRRSATAKSQFRRAHPCPANGKTRGACPGFVLDHYCPLACCGPDTAANLQWQSHEESEAKDAWEVTPAGCRELCHLVPAFTGVPLWR